MHAVYHVVDQANQWWGTGAVLFWCSAMQCHEVLWFVDRWVFRMGNVYLEQ